MQKLSTSRHGFTLIELSIVLVIIGLIVGGVVTGRSLIRSAELRSVVTDIQRYQTAIVVFREKYAALPGDMTNATTVWGDDAAVCPDATITDGTPGTCNGNGDQVLNLSGDGVRAWQHLALAGFVAGKFKGVTGTVANHIGGSIPKSNIGEIGYEIEYYTKASTGWSGDGSTIPNNEIRIASIYLGADPPVRASTPIFTPDEAWSMDSKIDDGKPGSGRFYAYVGPCSQYSGDIATAEYYKGNSDKTCLMQMVIPQ